MVIKQLFSLTLLAGLLVLGGCAVQDGPPKEKRDVSKIPDAVPRVHDGEFKDAPYTLNGVTYTPIPTAKGYEETGVASWYGTKFHGRRTANGEVYDLYGMTAAHKTLPLPSYVRVVNRDNGRSVVVRVNDRGPFHGNRVIDVSYAAARKLGFANVGVANVFVEGIDVEAFTASQQENGEDEHPKLFLQLAALKNYHSAQMLRRSIAKTISDDIKVIKGDDKPEPLYRVRIGPVVNPEHLESLLEKLDAGEYDVPYLVYDGKTKADVPPQ